MGHLYSDILKNFQFRGDHAPMNPYSDGQGVGGLRPARFNITFTVLQCCSIISLYVYCF